GSFGPPADLAEIVVAVVPEMAIQLLTHATERAAIVGAIIVKHVVEEGLEGVSASLGIGHSKRRIETITEVLKARVVKRPWTAFCFALLVLITLLLLQVSFPIGVGPYLVFESALGEKG